MGGNHHLIPISQKLPGKFHAKCMSLFWCNFAGGVGVDQVIAQDTAFFAPVLLGLLHFLIGCFRLAVNGCLQNRSAVRGDGLIGVSHIFQYPAKVDLIGIQNIIHAMIQPPFNGDDLVIGHYSVSFTSRYALCTRVAAS